MFAGFVTQKHASSFLFLLMNPFIFCSKLPENDFTHETCFLRLHCDVNLMSSKLQPPPGTLPCCPQGTTAVIVVVLSSNSLSRRPTLNADVPGCVDSIVIKCRCSTEASSYSEIFLRVPININHGHLHTIPREIFIVISLDRFVIEVNTVDKTHVKISVRFFVAQFRIAKAFV